MTDAPRYPVYTARMIDDGPNTVRMEMSVDYGPPLGVYTVRSLLMSRALYRCAPMALAVDVDHYVNRARDAATLRDMCRCL